VTLACRRDELLWGFDDDVRVMLAQELRARGIEIRVRTDITRIDKRGHGYDLATAKGETLSADLVMYARDGSPTRAASGSRRRVCGSTTLVRSWSTPGRAAPCRTYMPWATSPTV